MMISLSRFTGLTMFIRIPLFLLFIFLVVTQTKNAYSAEVSTISPEFQASGGLVVGPNGEIYVADYGEQTIMPNGVNVYRLNSSGELSVFARGIRGASGNVIGPDGVLYQASYIDGKVYQINDKGETSVFASGKQLVGPVGLQFDSTGTLYVANCNNNTIVKQRDGKLSLYVSSSSFSCPAGLAMDDSDNLYVTNYGHGIIHKITPDGSISEFARTPNGKTKPNGGNAHITFGNNQLYVVSSATHQVFSITMSGELKLVAGSGKQGRQDGDVELAEFSLPNGIDISSDNTTLYVNDSQTIGDDSQVAPNVVRKISLK
jgi:sugar lactone lactonase YvrE